MHMLFQPYVTSSAKTSQVCTLNFIAPTYKTMLNKYACLLPPLANVNWSAFSECFLPTIIINSRLVK